MRDVKDYNVCAQYILQSILPFAHLLSAMRATWPEPICLLLIAEHTSIFSVAANHSCYASGLHLKESEEYIVRLRLWFRLLVWEYPWEVTLAPSRWRSAR